MNDRPDSMIRRLPLLLSTSRPAPGVLVVHVDGELDMWTTPMLEQYVTDESSDAPAQLVFDLAGVRFMGSHGCALVARLYSAGSARVSIAGPPPHVRRVLEITGLTEVVPCYPRVIDLPVRPG